MTSQIEDVFTPIGWRLDYCLVLTTMKKYIDDADVLTDVYGSGTQPSGSVLSWRFLLRIDHCPVSLTLSSELRPPTTNKIHQLSSDYQRKVAWIITETITLTKAEAAITHRVLSAGIFPPPAIPSSVDAIGEEKSRGTSG